MKKNWVMLIGGLFAFVCVLNLYKISNAKQTSKSFLVPEYNWESSDVVLKKNVDEQDGLVDEIEDNDIRYSIDLEEKTACVYEYWPEDENGSLKESGDDRMIRIPDKLCINNREYVVNEIDMGDAESSLRQRARIVFAIGKYINKINLDDFFFQTAVVVHPENQFFASDNGSLYSKDYSVLYRFDGAEYGTDGVFSVPDSVETLRGAAFLQACVKEVVLNQKIKSIPKCCFFRSDILRINTKNVSSIESSAFQHSCRLKFAYLPNVKQMGDFCFADCRRMDKVVLSTQEICDFSNASIFEDCWQLRTLLLPENLEAIGTCFLKNCVALRILYLPSTVKKVEADSFCVGGNLRIYTMGEMSFLYNDDNVVFCRETAHVMKSVVIYSCEDWNLKGEYCEACGYGVNFELGTGRGNGEIMKQPVDICPKECEVSDALRDDNGLKYSIDEGEETARVVSADYNRPYKRGFYMIPENIVKDGKKYRVVAIGNSVFTNLENMDVPCYIVLPDTVITLSSGWVSGSRISCIRFGKNVRNIGEFKSYGVDPKPIDTIYVPEDNPYFTMQDGVLLDKNMSTIYYCTAAVNREGYTVPKSVRKIREYAFDMSEVKSITLYNQSKMEIPSSTFKRCSAEVIDLADDTVEFQERTGLSDWMWYSNYDKVVQLDSEYADENGMQYNLNGLTQTAKCYLIPYALWENKTGIRIPDYVIYNGKSYLVTEVAPQCDYASKSSEAKEQQIFHIFIGQYVNQVSFSSFREKAAIHIHEDNTNYVSEDGSLFNIQKDQLIRFYDGNYTLNDVYQIPSSVYFIDFYAFYQSNIGSVILNSNVTRVPFGCFESSNVMYVNLKNVNQISSGAFEDTKRLKEIDISVDITNVVDNAFYGSAIENIRQIGVESVAVTDKNNSIRLTYGWEYLKSAPPSWFTGKEYGIPTPPVRVTPTPGPTSTPTVTPTNVPKETISPTATVTVTEKPHPTATATIVQFDEGKTASTQIPKVIESPSVSNKNLKWSPRIRLKINKKNEVLLLWGRIKEAKQFWIYSSSKRNAGFRVIKKLKKTAVSYKHKKAIWGRKNYYKVKFINKNGAYEWSNVCSALIPKNNRPIIKVQKKRMGEITYFTVQLKKYVGTNADIYLDTGKGFKKIKLFSHRIKKYKGKFKIQYTLKNKILRVKVRTYSQKGRKKFYSRYSKVKKIEV